MPTLTNNKDRRVVIDKRPGQYIAFPDVCPAENGRLVVIYRESDKHVATRSALLVRTSDDQGKTWSPIRILNAASGHCPRITRLSDGALVAAEDSSNSLYWSYDNGETFAQRSVGGDFLSIPDRFVEMNPETFLTTCHTHRGAFPHPKTRQATTEQMVYITTNRGGSFRPLSVLACDRCLVLCEASMTRLPDGRLLALLRENSSVYEPMYKCESADNGNTWSLPSPTPLLGHRPCLGVTPGGRLLVTYRDVGPDGGTAAWLGDVDELDADYAVHGRTPGPDVPRLTDEGLLIENKPGPDASARYALRPMTDPEFAEAALTAEVRVDRADKDGCGVHFGLWWRLFPDRIEAEGRKPVPVSQGAFHSLRFFYKNGAVTLSVDGKRRARVPVDSSQANTRGIVFGTRSPYEDNGGRHVWKALSLRIREPRYGRNFSWTWSSDDGLPDAWKRNRVLELRNDRLAAPMDYGYSGWTALPDGRFFCVYHHGGGDAPDYAPGKSSHVAGTWFSEEDFREGG